MRSALSVPIPYLQSNVQLLSMEFGGFIKLPQSAVSIAQIAVRSTLSGSIPYLQCNVQVLPMEFDGFATTTSRFSPEELKKYRAKKPCFRFQNVRKRTALTVTIQKFAKKAKKDVKVE